MKVKTIPALQLAIMGAAMYGLSSWFPVITLSIPGQVIVAMMISLFGVLLVMAGGVSFRRAKTTVNPIDPTQTTELVVEGIYRYTRNPMYLGFLLMLLGWGTFLGGISSFLMLPLFVWVITQFQIIPEEQVLAEKFGISYQEYLAQVRRWI